MGKRLKYIFVLVLASQVVLFLVYYTLTNKTPTLARWNIGKVFRYNNDHKNSTAGDSASLNFLGIRFWEMVGWEHGSQGKSSTKAPSSQQYGVNVSKQEAVSSSTSQTKPTTITLQTTSMAPTVHPENQNFQKIDDKNAYIYSAYFDHVAAQQGKPMVLVIGIFLANISHDLYCNLGMGNMNSFLINASAEGLPGHHDKKYTAGYIQCRLSENIRPTHVSISYQRNSKATNRLQVIYPGTLIRNFTVCYSILHSHFNLAAQLIQSLEMNLILGAEHFLVYKQSVSPAVDQILRRYQEDGLLTVLPWTVPMREVHYFGQLAALNDCNYRNRNITRFEVFVDTDELIIPRSNVTWMELLDTISPQEHDVSAFIHPSDPSRKGLNLTGSFEFRSSFFTNSAPSNWSTLPFSNEEKNNILKYQFTSLWQFWRDKEILPPKFRTKYITRPELVFIAGIHYVHSFVSNMSTIIVNDNLVLVHHYRSFNYKEAVMDTSILKFKNQLYSRIMQQRKRFSSIFT